MSTNELIEIIRKWRKQGYRKVIIKLSATPKVELVSTTKTLVISIHNSYEYLEKFLNSELSECRVYPNRGKLEFLIL